MNNNGKDSAQLEREVEAQRQQIENRIGEIRERLSPGQLVDELLSYTKNGGQQFASNLGSTVASNPLPVALMGIGLAWLISGQGPKFGGHTEHSHTTTDDYDYEFDYEDYPYATVSGGLRRVSHAADPTGKWYSEFEDSTGNRYKAESNEHGRRLGHFMDRTGRKIGGFIDEAGHRVRDFQDEAGNRLGDAMGWTSHRWRDMRHGVGQALGQVGQQAQQLGSTAQAQVERTNRMAMDMFQDQPLVGGALAFAIGAALGAALPHTEQEDKVAGKLADKVRTKAAEVASDVYEEGKSRAADLYEKGKEGAAQVYEDVAGRRPELH